MTNENPVAPMHYADWFRRHAATRGGAVAITTPNGRITYGGIHRALHACAWRLAECGIERGQTVAICVFSETLHCVLIAALNRMGCVPVTVSRPLKKGVAIALPRALAIDRVLVEQPFEGDVPAGSIDVHLDWLQVPKQKTMEWQGLGLRDSGARAHIFTSSGTTGALKAIGCSTRQLEARIFKRSIGILSAGRMANSLCLFGLRSTIGFQTTFSALWAGGSIFLGFSGKNVFRVIARERIERVEASPAQYQGMLEHSDPSGFDLSSLRFCVVSGSATPPVLITAIRNTFCNHLIGHYGATELGAISFGRLRAADPPGLCGHLVPWMQVETVDQDGNVLPEGVEGILRFRCEEMASGYLNDAEASEKHFRDGWFHVGDSGSVSAAREVTLSGRLSERINAGGVKVAPEIVERAVEAFEGVVDCAAFGIPDAMGIDEICAAIVVDRAIDLEKLRKHCNTKLGVRAPVRFVILPEVPRNENGKILRGALPKLMAETGVEKSA